MVSEGGTSRRRRTDEPDDDEIARCDVSVGGPHAPNGGRVRFDAVGISQITAEPEFKINAFVVISCCT
jgi:hypothetical protein